MSDLTAVVLAAGEGKRLRPLTSHRPKPMLSAGTRPILEHTVDAVIDAGITSIVVVVGYKRTDVQSHLGPSYRGVSLTYAVQEKQLGTGHAVLAAEPYVDGSFLVVNGDQVIDRRIVEDVLETHASSDAVATLGLLRRSDVGDYGGVLTDGESVTEIVEAPRDDRDYRLNAGVYAFEPVVFDAIRRAVPRAGEQQIVDAIEELIDERDGVRGVESEGFWADATYPWDLLDVAETIIENGGQTEVSRTDSSLSVHDSAVIREPIVAGDDCEIGPNAVVGPNVTLGTNATVGSNAVVERCVVDTDVRIGENATLIDCVVGRGVHVGAGAVVPGGPGDVRVGDRIHEDRQLGALFGDRVDDRGGTRYVPGAIVGADAVVRAGSLVSGRNTDVRTVGR
ncbi:sugar phosphate nucleotidyltransferase [Natrarchaeobius chitinivorans]|uniref:Nucleotidyl transferase n=1 Tax=Natrarchaeobius chitinivorans TaxID=1679083 RepID=A0A3N6LQT6_NATCH|nr:sugar phosphate nucleotidyltransferase [Natrarchaeobius chitinivorans]RQG92008.1 nucleotidyl transferase [Natrarchaeobius chitinivorans]